MRLLALASLLLLTPTTPSPQELPTRTLPDTRSIGWVLIDSTSLEQTTVYAAEQKVLNKEAARCLVGGIVKQLLPDSILLVSTTEAFNIEADSVSSSFDCPPSDSLIGTLHTHIHMADNPPCRFSVVPQHAGGGLRQRDDYNDMLFSDADLVDYLMCDNGWVVWELKDGRMQTFRWRAF